MKLAKHNRYYLLQNLPSVRVSFKFKFYANFQCVVLIISDLPSLGKLSKPNSFSLKKLLQGPPNTFFLENALKSISKLLNIFSNFFFYLKVQQGPPNTFFLEIALKSISKLLNIFSNLFFNLKAQSFRLITENNFIQIAASAGSSLHDRSNF